MIIEAKQFIKQNFSPFIKFLDEMFPNTKIVLTKLKSSKTAEELYAESILLFFISFSFFVIFLTTLLSAITLNQAFALLSSLFSAFIFSFLISFIYILSPSIQLKSRASKIEKELYFSLPIFSSFISDKTPLHISIKQFCETNKEYLLAQELEEINKMVEFGGVDLITAINRKILVSPSEKLANILTGLASILKGGGSVSEYMKIKSDEIINEYRQKIRESGRKIGLFFQIYIIAFVIGILLFLILTSVFSLISPIPNLLLIQFFIVCIAIPLLSIMMVILVKSFLP